MLSPVRTGNVRRWRRIAAAFSVVVVGACGAGTGDGDGGDPLADGDPNTGRELFANNCAQCHGVDLQGTDQGPPFIHEVYVPSHHSDESFLLAVQRGVQPHHWDFGAMPPVPALSVEEVADIVAYVREQQRQAGLIE